MSKFFNVQERTKGIIVPLVTWLDASGNIDLDSMGTHVDRLILNGCNGGIFILGTTGEFPYIPFSEKQSMMAYMVTHVKGRVPVLAGISAPGVKETVQLGQAAIKAGIDGVFAIVPQYFPLDQGDIESFYRKVADGLKGEIPLFLYYMPILFKYKVPPELVFKLAKDRVIQGIKQTSFDVPYIAKLRNMLKSDFTATCNIWPGTDTATLECLKQGIGIDGCIIGSINMFPGYYKALFKAYADNPRDQTLCTSLGKINELIMNLFAIDLREVPALVKEALHAAGLPFAKSTSVLPPLPSLSPETKAKMLDIMQQLKSKFIVP